MCAAPSRQSLDYRAIFAATPSPYLVLSPELVIVDVNDAYLRATCKTTADLVGRGIFEAFPDNPNDPSASGVRNLRDSLERVLREKVPDTMAVQRYDIPVGDPAQGRFEERYWSPINTPVRGEDGCVLHIIHRVEDVTFFIRSTRGGGGRDAQALELEAANQRLRESEERARQAAEQADAQRERLDAVMEAVPAGIFVVAADGRLVSSNPENARIWGGTAMPSMDDDAAWGGWWADGSGHHGEPLRREDWPLHRALRGERVDGCVIEISTLDAPPERKVVLAAAAPIRNAPGEVTGAVVAVKDITTRVRAEQALRQSERRRDEYLAMFAHELRNPLAPIRAAADMLTAGQLQGERLAQAGAIIGRQVGHLGNILDTLLDVSRLTRGLVTLECTDVDLAGVVAEAVDQCRPLIDRKHHALAIDLPTQDLRVHGDRKRLVQMLGNLLTNAAQYTAPGGRVSVAVRLDGALAVFEVADNGVGMPQHLLEQVFELFAQGERQPDRSQGGLGVGLPVVRRLAELHGGSASVFSAGPGQGSRVEVRLPVDVHVGTQGTLPVDTAHAPRILSVLVVDDNVDAADMLGMLLHAMGHHASVEYGSLAALRRAKAERPNVCLLDIGLPEMDGHALARALREQFPGACPFLVAVTGYGREEDRENALRAGFDRHMTKPVDGTQLEQLLRGVVSGMRSQAA